MHLVFPLKFVDYSYRLLKSTKGISSSMHVVFL